MNKAVVVGGDINYTDHMHYALNCDYLKTITCNPNPREEGDSWKLQRSVAGTNL